MGPSHLQRLTFGQSTLLNICYVPDIIQGIGYSMTSKAYILKTREMCNLVHWKRQPEKYAVILQCVDASKRIKKLQWKHGKIGEQGCWRVGGIL
jgi:hypothetical protein